MILILHACEQERPQQPLVQLTRVDVLQEPVRPVCRLHDTAALRPRSVIGDVAGRGEHGQLLQIVVAAKIEAIAVEYAGRYEYRMKVGVVEPKSVYDHVAKHVLIPSGF